MRKAFGTLVAWLFLAIVLGTFAWYFASTLVACALSTCNESDASAVGSILGLGLLVGVPWLLRRSRRW